jgi:hypothetical protein
MNTVGQVELFGFRSMEQLDVPAPGSTRRAPLMAFIANDQEFGLAPQSARAMPMR